MHRSRLSLLLLNLVGGLAVLGSYGFMLATHPDVGDALWGGVPRAWVPLYTASMLSATAGYFAFAQHLFLRANPDETRFGGLPFTALHAIFALILLPSAVWMPLTFAYLDAPSGALFLVIRVVLALVGLGSLALVVALLRMQSRGPRVSWALAVVGSLLFLFQTGVLDALVWTHYFPLAP